MSESSERTQKSSMQEKVQRSIGWILQIPSIFFIGLIVIIPLVYALYISFLDYSLVRRTFDFIGINNYLDFLSNPRYSNIVINTFIFSISSIFFIMIIGLSVALVLNEGFKGRGIVIGLLLIPWATPGIVNGTMWKWLLNGKYGVINYLLKSMGLIDRYISFLGSAEWAMPSTVIAYVWKMFPWASLLLMAGMAVIPNVLYEQSKVDGSNIWQRFIYITLPLMRGTIILTLIFETIWALRAFDVIFALTSGGPAGATTVWGWWVYEISFRASDFGMGSAIGWILALVTMLISVVYVKYLYKELRY